MDYSFAICVSIKIISISDIRGREVLRQGLTGAKTHVDISRMAKGIYIVKIINSGSVQVRLIIIE